MINLMVFIVINNLIRRNFMNIIETFQIILVILLIKLLKLIAITHLWNQAEQLSFSSGKTESENLLEPFHGGMF